MNYPNPAFTIHDELSNLTPEQIIVKMFESTDKDGHLCIPEWPYDDKDYDEPDMYYLCSMNWDKEDLKNVTENFQKLEQRLKTIKDEDPLQSIIRENRDLVPFSDMQPDVPNLNILKETAKSEAYAVASRSVRLCKLYTMNAPMVLINNEAQLLAQALAICQYGFSIVLFVKIWLDDIRPAPKGYYHCHSVNEAKAVIEWCELKRWEIAEISCDHDLGDFAKDGGDGICLIDWLRERKSFYYQITLHSANPVGRENMQKALDRYKEEEKEDWDNFVKMVDADTYIIDALMFAASYFQEQLYSDEGVEALEWLKNRGLTDETIKRFNLGYSGKTKDGLHRYLTELGYRDEELITETCLSYYRKMTAHDYFFNRIMIPIFDGGLPRSFSGHTLDGEGPVYLNAPENGFFNKKEIIYGLYLAKESGKTELILCEGYLDVILLHQEGFSNAVSTPWSSLTKEQAAVLKQYADSVILSYDSDEAGKRGAARAAKLLKEAGLSVKQLDVSPYRDPYELLRKEGKSGYARRLEEAETV